MSSMKIYFSRKLEKGIKPHNIVWDTVGLSGIVRILMDISTTVSGLVPKGKIEQGTIN